MDTIENCFETGFEDFMEGGMVERYFLSVTSSCCDISKSREMSFICHEADGYHPRVTSTISVEGMVQSTKRAGNLLSKTTKTQKLESLEAISDIVKE